MAEPSAERHDRRSMGEEMKNGPDARERVRPGSGEMKEKDPLISVIVPVYNAEPYLERCVDSIIRQTYRNLEIILVDDGSADESPEICERYAKTDHRIKVIHQANSGAAGARNAGLRAASGDYIGFVDSDDKIRPDMYRSLLASCLEDHADFAWCGTVCVRGETKEKRPGGGRKKLLDGKKVILQEMLERGINSLSVWDKLFRAEKIRGIRFPDIAFNEDIIALYHIADRCETAVLTGRYDYCYFLREKDEDREKYSREKAAALLFNLKTIRGMIAPRYPDLLPLYEKNEAEISFILLNQYLKCGGRTDTGEYRKLKKIFDRNFRRLTQMKPYRMRAVLLYTGAYRPLRSVYCRLRRR